MVPIVKLSLIKTVEILHLHIFGHAMSDAMRKFLGQLTWSFVGGMMAAGILFAVNILAGRLLGPEEFGKYSITVAISEVILVILVLGLDIGAARIIAKEKDKIDKQKTISNSLLIFLVSSFTCIPFIFFVSRPIINSLGIDSGIFFVALLFSIALGLKRITDGFVRGLGFFSAQAAIKVIEALLVILAFLFFYRIFGITSYNAFVISLAIGAIFLSSGYLWKVRENIAIAFIDNEKIRKVIGYSKFGIIGGISGIFLQSFDKLFVNGLIGQREVGIYAAYYTVSIVIISQIVQLVVNVFFPTVSAVENKSNVVRKLDVLLKRGFIAMFLSVLVMTRFFMMFFGSEYPIYWDWIFILSVYGVVHFYVSMYGWTLVSISSAGFKQQNVGLILGMIVYMVVLLTGCWTAGFSIELLLIGLVLNRLTSGAYYWYALKSFR